MRKKNTLDFAVFAAAMLPMATSARAANIQMNATGPLVELSVSEEVRGAPDMATISTGITTRAATASEALRQNSAQVDRLIARIKSMGIAARDMQTSGISVNAQYDYQKQERVFLGYDVSNNLSVVVRDLPRLGGLIDALVDAGANNLSGPWFSIANDDPLKQTARERALDRATALAKFYAGKAGYAKVRIVAVSESLSGTGPVQSPVAIRMMDASSVKAAPVEPGEVGVSASLSMTFEMTQ